MSGAVQISMAGDETAARPEPVPSGEDPNAPPWRPSIEFVNRAAVGQVLRDAAADRLAAFRGEALPDEQERLDRNGRELLEAVLNSEPSQFGCRLRGVEHAGRVGLKWLGDRKQLLESEVRHASDFLCSPEKPRWNKTNGEESLELAIESLRTLDQATVIEDLARSYIEALPVELARTVGRVLEDAGSIDQALHGAWLLAADFEPGSPLAALQEAARDARQELATDPNDAFARKILAGIEDRAADLDGPADEALQDLCGRAAAIRARIKRVAEMADAASEDASAELSALRKQLKPVDAEVADRRSKSPRYARQRTLREQAAAGDIDAIADLHRFALTVPAEFPGGFAAAIREAVLAGFVAAGFGRWVAENGLFWS
jgi:hypothetical protein